MSGPVTGGAPGEPTAPAAAAAPGPGSTLHINIHGSTIGAIGAGTGANVTGTASKDAYPLPNEDHNLLNRVLAICELRETSYGRSVKIRTVPASSPFGIFADVCTCEVTGEIRTYALAALNRTPDFEALQQFSQAIHQEYQARDRHTMSTLVYTGQPANDEIVFEAKRQGILVRSFIEYQGLLDFRSFLADQSRRLGADREDERSPYSSKLFVPPAMTLGTGNALRQQANALVALETWLMGEGQRLVVLLGGFGTGKTFLLRELTYRLANSSLVPVFIEMRSLEKVKSLPALLGQYFVPERGMSRFDHPAFQYMLREGRIVLIFDGFDELALRVRYDSAVEHFDTVLSAAQGGAKIVISSRTQHFLSDSQVTMALGEKALAHGFRLAKIQHFDRERITRFLYNKLGNAAIASERLRLISEIQDLMGLAETPRMLGFIADLEPASLRDAIQAEGKVTPAALYKLLLDRWLVFEYERAHPRGTEPGLTLDQRWKAVTELAVTLWRKKEDAIPLTELPDDITHAVRDLASHLLEAGIVTHQIGSGTLLCRDDNGRFSFMHKSIAEWLVAEAAALHVRREGDSWILTAGEFSTLMIDFFVALCGQETAAAWARLAANTQRDQVAKKNALRVLRSLGKDADEALQLIGHDLRGQDFSDQDLRGAALDNADLSDVRMVRARLDGAMLRNATLVRADLSDASLVGADLTGSDLSFAKLLGADLTGAKLEGVKLRYSKLVGAQLDNPETARPASYGCAPAQPRMIAPTTTTVASSCTSLAVSRDGVLLLSGHGDGTIRIWEIATARLLRTLEGHGLPVHGLAISRDGQSMASASADKSAILWQLLSGTAMHRFELHRGAVHSVAYSADSRWLVTAGAEGVIGVWDTLSLKDGPHRIYRGHTSAVRKVAIANGIIASASYDNSIILRSVVEESDVRVLCGHSGAVYDIAFSPDGATLYSVSSDRTMRIWDVESGTPRGLLEHSEAAFSVACASNGLVATGGLDKIVHIWHVPTKRVIHELRGHSSAVLCVTFDSTEQLVISGSSDKHIFFWDVTTGQMVRNADSQLRAANSLAFQANGTLLVAYSSGSYTAWGVVTGEMSRRHYHASPLHGIAVSSKNSVALGCSDGKIRLRRDALLDNTLTLDGGAGEIRAVAFVPGGDSIAVATSEGTINIWDCSSSILVRSLRGHVYGVHSIAFDVTGRFLASGSADRTAALWDLTTSSEPRFLRAHTDTVRAVCFTPDGGLLISGSDDATIRLWNCSDGVLAETLRDHSGPVNAVAISPDGRTLASGSSDKTISLWSVAARKKLIDLTGHTGPVLDLAFSPNGKILASASADGTVRLWDAESNTMVATLVATADAWVAFTPDGRYRSGGDVNSLFWHLVGLCRFSPGELDPYRHIPLRVADSVPLVAPNLRQQIVTWSRRVRD